LAHLVDAEIDVGEIVLRRTPRISGHISGEGGRHLRAAQFVGYTTYRDLPTVNLDRLDLLAPGSTASVGGENASVNLMTALRIGDDGSFEYDLPASGRVMLVCHARGHRPLIRDLGRVTEDTKLDLVVQQSLSHRIRVQFGGDSLGERHVMIGDVTGGRSEDPQPAVSVLLSERDGRIPGEYLIVGRAYVITVFPLRGGPSRKTKKTDELIMRKISSWDDREVIDLAELPAP